MTTPPHSPSPETLLAQRDFVRELVRSLLRGADGADDVVQQTWQRAMTSPPRDANRARQWLARVARNLVRDQQRGDARRSAHEFRAAAPDRVPSTADVVQREDERRRVVEAVLAMSDPYRTAVLLRYWEDLPPREIAERLGLPAATVRSHLHRGLAMLRERLDADYGDRGRWTAAFLPCAALWRAPSPLTGAVLMSTKLKVLIAAGCVLLAGLALSVAFGSGGGGPIAPGSVSVEEMISEAPSASAAVDEVARAAPGETADERRAMLSADGELTIHGTATAEGRPVADLRLRLQWFAGYDDTGDPEREQPVRTAADGSYAWRGAALDAGSLVRIVSADPRVQVSCTPEFVTSADALVRLDAVCTELGCELHGVVTGPTGEPLANARIRVRNQGEYPADARGRYSVPVGRGQTSPKLTFQAPDHTPRVLHERIPADATRHRLDVQLAPGGRISGRVVDDEAAPVGGARVVDSLRRCEVVTAADGSFELAGLDPTTSHYLEVKKIGHVSAGGSFSVGTTDAELVLRRGLALAGRVLGPGDRAIAGALVLVVDALRGDAARGYSEADGAFEVAGIAAGKRLVMVTKSGFVAHSEEVTVGPETGELVVHLEVGRRVAGRVVDPEGAPIAGAGVGLLWAKGEHTGIDDRGHTDADGRFEIADLPETATVDLAAFQNGYLRGDATGVAVGRLDVVIRMDRGASLAGRVLDARTRQPIDRFGIRLANAADELRFMGPHTVSGTDGFWTSPSRSYRPGKRVHVEVEAEGYAPARIVADTMVEPPPDRNVILLDPAARLAGTVRDELTGQPIANATVKLLVAERRFDETWMSSVPGTTTDGDGRFGFSSPGAGPIRIVARHPEYADEVHGPVEVGPGVATIDVTMGRGAAVRGRIEGFVGLDLDVHLMRYGGPDESQRRSLGAARSFAFDGVADGRHLLAIHAEGRLFLRAELVTIDGADIDELVLREIEGPCTLAVTVRGLDSGEARIRPKDGTPGSIRRLRFAGGAFEVGGLAPGTHRVRIEDDRRQVEREVELRAGAAGTLVIEFER